MRKLVVSIAVFAFSLVATAQMNQLQPMDPNVKQGKLENGLTYYIRHNANPENRADFYIAQRVGSMQEEDNQMGLAHFLEHMAFNGSKNFPGRKTMTDYLEKSGVKFGVNVNAYTSFDETVYNLSNVPVVRPTMVDSCMLILHDWSSFITLDNAEIDQERAIIKEEWRTRSGAQIRIWEKQLPILFAGSKYANRLPIGSMGIVENFEYQVLKDYYHKWYRPDLQAIIIVGDIDAVAVEAKLKSLFSDIPTPVNPAKRVAHSVPDNDAPIVAITTDPEATSTRVTLYLKHDILPAEVKKTEMGLVFSFVKNLASTMLTDRLTEIAQKSDAPFAAAGAYDGSYFVSRSKDAWTAIGISKEGKIDATLATLLRENERIKRFGFTESEVERAKANLLKNYETNYNNRNKQENEAYINEYVASFTQDEAMPGIEYEYNFLKQFAPMNLNAESVNQMVRMLISSDKGMVISVTGPEKEGITYPTEKELLAVVQTVKEEVITAYEEEVSDEALITQLPKKGTVVKAVADKKLGATVWTLSNGMRVVLKKTDFKDDQIVMTSVAHGGTSIFADKDIHNAEFVTAVPYIGGIGNFSATNLKKVLAGKSANVNVMLGAWDQSITGSSSIKDVETMLQLTYLYFTAPRKDQEAYTSILEMIKTQIKNQTTEPASVFNDSTIVARYGDNVRFKSMKEKDVEALNYDRIITMYKEAFANPGSFVFTLVGNVDEATIKPLVEQYLASLPAGNKDAMYKKVKADIRKGIYSNVFEQEMKTPKTTVFELYSTTLPHIPKNLMTLSALKQVLDIVYMQTVREEAGGTYGVGTRAAIERIPAGQTTFQISFDTDPEKVTKLLPIIQRDIQKIADQGPEDTDVQKVKEYMAKKFEEDIKTNGYWNTVLVTAYFDKKKYEDFYSNYIAILNTISKEDIQAIAKQLITQGNKIEVIMNPKSN